MFFNKHNNEIILDSVKLDTMYNPMENTEVVSWNPYLLAGIAILILVMIVKKFFWKSRPNKTMS